MKHKKSIYYFLIFSLLFSLSLPALNLFLTHKYQKLDKHIFSKERLFSTDHLESIRNYLVYKLLNVSVNETQVIAGKDGFFFLGNGFSRIIDKTTGRLSYAKKDIDPWVDKVKQLQNWYQKQGIEFILVIAPNKHTVYNDKLPKGIVYKEGGTITDDIVEKLHQKNIPVLNLKNVLRTKKEEKLLYFHTDTHWNDYGGYIGYIATMHYLNKTYGEDYKIAKYIIKETKKNGGGDLTNFLKINHLLSENYEKNYQFTATHTSNLCYGVITLDNQLTQCTPGVKYKFNQYSINKNAINKEKLLYICDSFGLVNSERYEETFQTVWRFHVAYKSKSTLADFVKAHKPDIVIYQIVERDLMNNTIIDDLAFMH